MDNPNWLLLEPLKLAIGIFRLVRLNRLNASARNCKLTCSPTLIFLNSEMSICWKFGEKSQFFQVGHISPPLIAHTKSSTSGRTLPGARAAPCAVLLRIG